MRASAASGAARRARPLLGTLVEVGVAEVRKRQSAAVVDAVDAAFGTVVDVQRCMSRFDPTSDIARFNASASGAALAVHESTAEVLAFARQLHDATGGLFDVSGGLPQAWRLEGLLLHKSHPRVRLDLGGIAKGYAVDRAVAALRRMGVVSGWVNAGGDLRVFGSTHLPIALRDDAHGGVRRFGTLSEGAFATSHYGAGSRVRLHAVGCVPEARVSVAAPECVWADALTKVVALSGDTSHPLLIAREAVAWLH